MRSVGYICSCCSSVNKLLGTFVVYAIILNYNYLIVFDNSFPSYNLHLNCPSSSQWKFSQEQCITLKPGPEPACMAHIHFGVLNLDASDSMPGMCA